MTAEIAIMNKLAVALAADSAVTIGHSKGQKIYDTVNKLFELTKHHPVGVMIYGNAELMDVPWELIIKLYRKELGPKSFATVAEYATNFFEYLEGKTTLFPPEAQETEVLGTLFGWFGRIRDEINRQVEQVIKASGKITVAGVRKVAKEAIASHHGFWRTRPDLPITSDVFRADLITKYKRSIEQVRKQVFQNLSLDARSVTMLTELAGFLFSKTFPPSGRSSGLVIAGYGEAEVFPSLVS